MPATLMRFFQNFSTVVAPIINYMNKGQFTWTQAASKAFEEVKKRMTQAPVLQLPDLYEVFEVACDASHVGIGVLSQEGHPVAFFGENLNDTKVNHSLSQGDLNPQPPILGGGGDLHKLGGLPVVIRELNNPDPEMRTTSAWILGKASQNNPLVQKQVLELGALMKLMKMVKSSSIEEATKALFAVSALVRNNLDGQELFYAEAGDLMLQDIMSNSSIDIRLRKKSVFLVADLAEYQLEARNKAELPFFSNHFFLKSVVDLTASTDLDLQEKALVAIKNLLLLRTTEALVLKDFCGLDVALVRMRQQLQHLMVEEYRRDYVMDLESLRREVELIFRGKLDKVTQVPT
ncbi:hypothetical protein F0562_032291 [Nyssa sinensis]|uniref:Reverse transcriptase/retrotransposon-derived protein RNase H-like domain-containing protein n=1 Tax=Nyssa sinensis TaxID=561372 RepID=A0A5J5APY7_9ASTE|nr:hypothetical protein F0562_032291 [Nyssa sinensis]